MVVRKYNVPDADCIQEARAVRLIYIQDEDKFFAFDPDTFKPLFKDDWEISLNKSSATETAETRQDQLTVETEEVLALMADSRKKYIQIKYFVEKAFEKSEGKRNKFGLDNYEEASQNQHAMALFMENLETQCNEPVQKAALLAAGLGQPAIDEIGPLVKGLKGEEAEQEAFKKTSGSATDERIAQYNESFEFWQKVARASKVIFYDNPTKQNEYELPHGTPGVEYKVEGKVTDGSNDNANLKNVIVAIPQNGFATVTNAYGNYGFVNLEPGNYTLNFTLDGYAEQNIPITVTQSGKVTKNASLVIA